MAGVAPICNFLVCARNSIVFGVYDKRLWNGYRESTQKKLKRQPKAPPPQQRTRRLHNTRPTTTAAAAAETFWKAPTPRQHHDHRQFAESDSDYTLSPLRGLPSAQRWRPRQSGTIPTEQLRNKLKGIFSIGLVFLCWLNVCVCVFLKQQSSERFMHIWLVFFHTVKLRELDVYYATGFNIALYINGVAFVWFNINRK